MDSEQVVSRSRRSVLAAAAGAAAALTAQALSRPMPVHAEGETMTVGGDFDTATTLTSLKNQTNNTEVFRATSMGSGVGISGISVSHVGVYGSGGGSGVFGNSTAPNGRGVRGEGAVGVDGYTGSGIGVNAFSLQGTGYALQATGRVKFNTVSGLATIAAGATSKTITPGVDVTSSSFVLLTPRERVYGRDIWYTVDAANNRFTIRMSSSRTSATTIAWLLLG